MNSRGSESSVQPALKSALTEHVLRALIEALSGIRFGSVTVIVQDGLVVQIDRTQRERLKSESIPQAGLVVDPAIAERVEPV